MKKTGIFVVATTMFLFNYGNFMKKETNSAKKQWTFFSFCLIKNSLFLYIQHKNNKKYNVI
ncbi:hypothetical protein D929_01746 [Enterococcus faecalis 02-MB-P-10]|nr:hypothetical protein D929_01746 [Enterococcus faecalis 02-MB-P-10]